MKLLPKGARQPGSEGACQGSAHVDGRKSWPPVASEDIFSGKHHDNEENLVVQAIMG
jgi:hypothetical protein